MSMWVEVPVIRGGMVYGATDELGYKAAENVCTVHDLHATMLHLLGIQHDAFSVKFQGSMPSCPELKVLAYSPISELVDFGLQ